MQPSSRTKSAGASSGTTFISKRLSWSPRSMTMQQEAKIRGAAHKNNEKLKGIPAKFWLQWSSTSFQGPEIPSGRSMWTRVQFPFNGEHLKVCPILPSPLPGCFAGYPSFSHTPTFVSSIRIGAGYLCQSKLPAMNHLTCSFGYVGRHPQVVASLHF